MAITNLLDLIRWVYDKMNNPGSWWGNSLLLGILSSVVYILLLLSLLLVVGGLSIFLTTRFMIVLIALLGEAMVGDFSLAFIVICGVSLLLLFLVEVGSAVNCILRDRT